jgi:hypothetical protein
LLCCGVMCFVLNGLLVKESLVLCSRLNDVCDRITHISMHNTPLAFPCDDWLLVCFV